MHIAIALQKEVDHWIIVIDSSKIAMHNLFSWSMMNLHLQTSISIASNYWQMWRGDDIHVVLV